MSIADFSANGTSITPVVTSTAETPAGRALHRIREVRAQQDLSVRAAARQMRTTARQVRLQEDPETDLHLSTLYEWQKALDVPVAHLLVDLDGPLSAPVQERAKLLRLMKTAMSLLEKAPDEQFRQLAQRMVDGLTEIMPELEGVSPWHDAGQRRRLDDFGRIVERLLSTDMLSGYDPNGVED